MLYSFFFFGWFPGIWILYANLLEHALSSIFIGGVSRKNDWDEIARVFMQVVVWLKMCLINILQSQPYVIRV